MIQLENQLIVLMLPSHEALNGIEMKDTYITLAYHHKMPDILSMEDLDYDLYPIFISWKFFENSKT